MEKQERDWNNIYHVSDIEGREKLIVHRRIVDVPIIAYQSIIDSTHSRVLFWQFVLFFEDLSKA